MILGQARTGRFKDRAALTAKLKNNWTHLQEAEKELVTTALYALRPASCVDGCGLELAQITVSPAYLLCVTMLESTRVRLKALKTFHITPCYGPVKPDGQTPRS